MRLITSLVTGSRLDYVTAGKQEEFSKSLRELISMLFAVIFGVGLEKIGEAQSPLHFTMLLAVYSAVLLSWWGYNFGTVVGPAETAWILYLVDCAIVILYWFLIEYSFDWMKTISIFGVLYLLYSIWELLRYADPKLSSDDRKRIGIALIVNFACTLLFLGSWIWLPTGFFNESDWYFGVILLTLTVAYRYVIHRVYLAK